jgi:hypothetical protein
MKYKFREVEVKDGDEIEIPDNALSLLIAPGSVHDETYVVTWLERV